MLNITNKFDIYEVLMPLVLQNHHKEVDEYLYFAMENKVKWLQVIDSLLDRKRTLSEYCDELIAKYKYDDIKLKVDNTQELCKFLMNLLKSLSIDIINLPNLHYMSVTGFLHQLYYKYIGGLMSTAAFRGVVMEEIRDCREVQCDLISLMASHQNWQEVVFWIDTLQIPVLEWPRSFRIEQLQYFYSKYSKNSSKRVDLRSEQPPRTGDGNDIQQDQSRREILHNSEEIRHNTSENRSYVNRCRKNRNNGYIQNSSVKRRAHGYLQFPLSEDHILYVDNNSTALEMVREFNDGDIVAFHSKWKPSPLKRYELAMLQLAVNDKVFLVDCLTENIDLDTWRLIGNKVFNNKKILKIGFDTTDDIKRFARQLFIGADNKEVTSLFLDLNKMWRLLKCLTTNLVFPYDIKKSGDGLDVLAANCLGKPVDKTEQFCNWAQRPLRHEQIIYAAINVYCLLGIFPVLNRMAKNLGANLDDIYADACGAGNSYRKLLLREFRLEQEREAFGTNFFYKSPSVKEHDDTVMPTLSPKPIEGPVRPDSIPYYRFLCDVMFGGLCRELRKLGFDCIEVYPHKPIDMYLARAHSGRYVLTQGDRCKLFTAVVPNAQVFDLPKTSTANIVIDLIKCLNIDITPDFFQTRCLNCNSRQFIRATYNEMQLICNDRLITHEHEDLRWDSSEMKDYILCKSSTYTYVCGVIFSSSFIT